MGFEKKTVFSVKGAEYLQRIDTRFFQDIGKSGLVGILQDTPCQEVFPSCHIREESYRHPGFRSFNPLYYHHEDFVAQTMKSLSLI